MDNLSISVTNLSVEDLAGISLELARDIYAELKRENKSYVGKMDIAVQKLKQINLLEDKLIEQFGVTKLNN